MTKKKSATSGNTYTVSTLAELSALVDMENVSRLANDMAMYLFSVAQAKQMNPDMTSESMVWTDDGDHVITGITIKRKKK